MSKSKLAVPRKVFGKGGKATAKKYGKGYMSLLAKLRHEKNPKKASALRKQIAALKAAKKR